ncbi:MAG: T9SS type A sorting domain-containing protein [Candidatus Eisenbacteria bacterium]|nr:T9SS type A sorting domain-containing protein [Candidatus Eisenbacteria bacterium]
MNVAIPDNDPFGTLVGVAPLPAAGKTIDDVIVDVSMSHTYAGDLVLGLYYDVDNDLFGDIGPVMLMCTPGIVGCAIEDCCGCEGDLNGQYRFSDSGSGVLGEIHCVQQLPPGCYQPDPSYGPLAVFAGAPDGGQWMLYAWDYEAQDTGTIVEFSVWSRLGCGHPVLNVPADYPTVQAAVDAACSGDIVRIAPGTYGDVTAEFGSPLKTIVIEAADPNSPPLLGIVDIADVFRYSAIRNIRATSVRFKGDGPLDVSNVTTTGDLYIDGFAGDVNITNCVVGAQLHTQPYKGYVRSCTAGSIDLFEQEVAHVEDCVTNAITIHCRDNGGATIRGNTIIGNDTSPVLLGVSHFDQTVLIERNLLVGQPSGTDTGVSVTNPNSAIAAKSCNDVWRCATRWTGTSDPTGANGNISVNPLFCNAGSGNYTLNSNSPCAPGHHPSGSNCQVIGALPVGCPTSSTDDHSLTPPVSVDAAPNPSRGAVAFSISGATGDARVRIYDASGRAVRTLVVATSSGAGEAHWDARDDAGHPVAAGVYFYQLSASGVDATKRLIVIR